MSDTFQIPPRAERTDEDEYEWSRREHLSRSSLKQTKHGGVGEQRGGQLKGEKAEIFLKMYDDLHALYGTHAETTKAIGVKGESSAHSYMKSRGYLTVQMGEKILAEWKRTKKERDKLKEVGDETKPS